MESQTPIWLHSRKSSNLRILLHNLCRRLSRKEPKVQHATERIILQILAPIRRLINHDIHTIRIQQKHPMRPAISVLEIKRLRTVQVRTRGETIRVLVPHGANVLCGVESQRVRVLAEAIEIRVLGEFCTQAQVLGFEDERGGGRVEEDFVGVAAADFEGEWGRGVVEFEVVLGRGG